MPPAPMLHPSHGTGLSIQCLGISPPPLIRQWRLPVAPILLRRSSLIPVPPAPAAVRVYWWSANCDHPRRCACHSAVALPTRATMVGTPLHPTPQPATGALGLPSPAQPPSTWALVLILRIMSARTGGLLRMMSPSGPLPIWFLFLQWDPCAFLTDAAGHTVPGGAVLIWIPQTIWWPPVGLLLLRPAPRVPAARHLLVLILGLLAITRLLVVLLLLRLPTLPLVVLLLCLLRAQSWTFLSLCQSTGSPSLQTSLVGTTSILATSSYWLHAPVILLLLHGMTHGW